MIRISHYQLLYYYKYIFNFYYLPTDGTTFINLLLYSRKKIKCKKDYKIAFRIQKQHLYKKPTILYSQLKFVLLDCFTLFFTSFLPHALTQTNTTQNMLIYRVNRVNINIVTTSNLFVSKLRTRTQNEYDLICVQMRKK